MKIKRILVLLLSITVAILYVLLLNDYLEYEKPVFSTEKKEEKPNDSITVDKVLNFINDYELNNLYFYNIQFNEAQKLTNQEKIMMSYLALEDEIDFSKGVSYTKLATYLRTVFGKTLTLENEDLMYKDDKILRYDDETDTYTLISNKELELYLSKYNYIFDFKNVNSEYILTVNKFFEKEGRVYVSFGDLQNDMNMLFEIPKDEENKVTYIKNYVNSNYEDIIEDLSVYTYVFTKEDGSLVLKSYKKEK